MPSNPVSSQRASVAAAAVAALALTATASAQSVTVTVNGSAASLNPPPIERAGRVFVPLRGVFEKLGASVVYANGEINATGNGRTVQLHVGRRDAVINGQSQMVDVAPFIVGASTYVPLRFVAQSLGATVNYDNSNRVVAINAGNGAPAQTVTPQPAAAATAAPASALHLGAVTPARGTSVEATKPTIEGRFAGAKADPNTLKITIDGADVTSGTTRAPDGFVYAPQSPLISEQHTVKVSGKDDAGRPFDLGWTFTSGTSQVTNEITNLTPAEGAQVGGTFAVRGHTLPNSRVIVQAGVVAAPATVGGIVGVLLGASGGGNAARNELQADAQGNFATDITLNAPPGAQIRLRVDSTEPHSGAAAKTVTRTLAEK